MQTVRCASTVTRACWRAVQRHAKAGLVTSRSAFVFCKTLYCLTVLVGVSTGRVGYRQWNIFISWLLCDIAELFRRALAAYHLCRCCVVQQLA